MNQSDREEIEAILAESPDIDVWNCTHEDIDELIERHRKARAMLQRLLDLSEAEAIESDLAYNEWKAVGGPHRASDARALRLQQQYPEGY